MENEAHPTHNTQLNNILTTDQAAKFLCVHRETIKRNIRKGVIPGIRIGRSYLIPRDGLDKVLHTFQKPVFRG